MPATDDVILDPGALALQDLHLRDWREVMPRELPACMLLGTILCTLGAIWITVWQFLGLFDYGP
ncbi:MAG TPA: hypothetical protein VKI44_05085 [Acetobacteraceae bacterium]|nr:hypothetical protein [Acetobacteraceae bacterium]